MGSFEFGVHRAFVSFSGSLLYSPKGQKAEKWSEYAGCGDEGTRA